MSLYTAETTRGRTTVALWIGIITLSLIVGVFFVMRLTNDVPHLVDGTLPERGSFEVRYVLHPVLAYAHIVAGMLYLAGAPLQLWRGFRERHFSLHRGLGRVLVSAGLGCGGFGVVFGILHPFGGVLEASAVAVFGTYFIGALLVAFRAIRARDVKRHRRWMIRAFAIGLAVGSIRIWVGVFEMVGLVPFELGFGIAFWLAFSLHAVAAEAYLRRRPGS